MGKLNLDELKSQNNLTQEQEEQLMQDIIAELNGDKPNHEEKPKLEPQEKSEKENKSKDEETSKESNQDKETNPEKEVNNEESKEASKESDESKESKEVEENKESEKEENKEQKSESKEDEEAKLKVEAEAQDKAKKEAFDKEVNDYATKNKVSVEEARKEFESIAKIQEKYNSDPKELAKANLNLQRMATKQQEQIKSMSQSKPVFNAENVPIENIINTIKQGKLTVNGKATPAEEVIEAYRIENPDTTLESDDDTVLKMIAKEVKLNLISNAKEQVSKNITLARDKRESLIKSLSEDDKKYIPEIMPILEKIPDSVIIDEGFSLVDTIIWAKGRKYDDDIKTAEERGYKRGKEEAKIIAQKPIVGNGTGATKAINKPTKQALTESEKHRAREMFDIPGYTDEQIFDLYREATKENKK